MAMARKGTVLVAMAALCWGISGGIAGVLLSDGWDAFVVSFFRGAIGLLSVLIWLALRPGASGLANRKLWFWLVIAGLGVAGNFAFYFLSIRQSSVAVAATLMYCAPVFVYLVSFVLKLERSTPLKWVAIGMVMLGIVLLTGVYKNDAGGVTLIGAGAGLLAGLSYAVFIFGFKYAAPHGTPQAILVIAFAALVTVFIWLVEANQVMAVFRSPSWLLFMLLGVLGAGLSFTLYIIGLHHTAPSVASVVAMVEPVSATLFGVAVLNESLGGLQIVGMALILITATALAFYSSAR
ncbi:DMT family transporter [Stutzerimonas stutzeri]|nr:DMT family transporter [Stutzerimonas stutzeri]HAB62981.1 EamA family transporter [Pseudomonas sp.]